jgi:peroxiredoxin
VTYHFEDPAAEFVLAGERELWLIETHGPLEHRLAMVQVRDDVEKALRKAKEKLDERG